MNGFEPSPISYILAEEVREAWNTSDIASEDFAQQLRELAQWYEETPPSKGPIADGRRTAVVGGDA